MTLGNRWIGLGLIIAMALFGLAVGDQLPARVPMHWGLDGQVNGYGSRAWAVWLTPGIGLGLWLLLTLLPRFDPLPADRGVALQPILGRYSNALLLFLTAVHVFILGNALGWQVPVTRVIGVGVGLLFVALGHDMGRLPRNSLAGIRLPWTLADEDVWRVSHRVGGRITLISGAVIALGGLLLPPVASLLVIGVAVIAMLIGVIGYSYWVAMQKQRSASIGQAPHDKS